jgi:hypothetical protein
LVFAVQCGVSARWNLCVSIIHRASWRLWNINGSCIRGRKEFWSEAIMTVLPFNNWPRMSPQCRLKDGRFFYLRGEIATMDIGAIGQFQGFRDSNGGTARNAILMVFQTGVNFWGLRLSGRLRYLGRREMSRAL